MHREDDMISRQAAIDAADSTDYTGLAIEDVKRVTDEVIKALKRLPSAQPEIIYCRDCKYYCHEDYGLPYCNRITTGFYAIDLDDFCSKAERKEDG